ncbi:MAG: toxin-antitoxin system HicB family antitoxin [Clostridium perfringens]|nr:toxin-antitoxin system HicB family antitoxin [Clostridium perfringens]
MAQSMTIRLDEELHKQIKIKATMEGKTVTDYILGLAIEDLKKSNKEK